MPHNRHFRYNPWHFRPLCFRVMVTVFLKTAAGQFVRHAVVETLGEAVELAAKFPQYEFSFEAE